MCNVAPMGISIERMEQLEEMAKYFYTDEQTHVYQDPDFPDNIVFTSERGDNYNTVGWFQVCFELILPKLVEGRDELVIAFATEVLLTEHHPVDLLYAPYLGIKNERTD